MSPDRRQSAPARNSPRGGRFVGIDLARFLAVCGMILAHVRWADWANGAPPDSVIDGNPSTLFALLGGVSVVLASRRFLDAGRAGAARRALLVRGGVVILLGLLLGLFTESPAVVVLVPFGLAMWGTLPFLRVRSWPLAIWAAVLLFAAQPLAALVHGASGRDDWQRFEDLGALTFADLAEPLDALRRFTLTGTFPAITWLGVLLVGMLLARGLLAALARGTQRRFALAVLLIGAAVAGVVLAVAAWAASDAGALLLAGWDAVAEPAWLPVLSDSGWAEWLRAAPHAGTPPDVLRGLGVGAAVLGGCLLLCWALPGPALTAIRPATAAGAAPMTVYTAHIVLLSVLGLSGHALEAMSGLVPAPWWLFGPGAVALHLGLALAIGAVLGALGRRGPLEALTSAAASRCAGARRR